MKSTTIKALTLWKRCLTKEDNGLIVNEVRICRSHQKTSKDFMKEIMLKLRCLQKTKLLDKLKKKKVEVKKERRRKRRRARRKAKVKKETMTMVNHKLSTSVHLRLFKDSMSSMKTLTITGIREMKAITTSKSTM